MAGPERKKPALKLSTQVPNVRHSEPRPIHTVLAKCTFFLNQQGTSCIRLNYVQSCVTLRITGVTVAQRKKRPSSCDGYTEF